MANNKKHDRSELEKAKGVRWYYARKFSARHGGNLELDELDVVKDTGKCVYVREPCLDGGVSVTRVAKDTEFTAVFPSEEEARQAWLLWNQAAIDKCRARLHKLETSRAKALAND